ncbi:MAG: DEAD/DEAH box helicase [Prevotella sp.]|nr:DEAD/DEAH box helicase [Prevotella sp.]
MEIGRLKEFNKTDKGLRPYQRDNKDKVYDVWQTHQSVMLQMPTGTGKTRTFVSIIKDIHYYSEEARRAYKVLILVHRKELVDQIDEELGYRYALAHGIIQSGDRERKKYPIQIASVQTLNRRLDNWTDKDFDFIIIDEAHHTTAESYQKIIKSFPNAKLLGVTATPCRLNGEGFTGTFDKLIVSPHIGWFIEKGYLCDCDYYSVPKYSFIQRQIDGITRFCNGDYAEQEMERICDNDRIRAQVVDTYLQYAKGKKGVVYTINKIHNKNLCDKFISHGINAVALDCDTPGEIRDECIDKFKRGKIQIICNVNLFTEGFDCPDIEFVQLARPTKSLALYLQQVGRGLRISENKEKVLILDNVGLYNKFGLPKSRRQWNKYFEGKFDIDEADVHKDKKVLISNKTPVNRTRQQNFEEGHEEVFLIFSSDEKSYIEARADEFWSILEDFYTYIVNSIAMEFIKDYGGTGLSLTIGADAGYKIYNVGIQHHTDALEEILYKTQFKFKDSPSGKLVIRTAKDYDELIMKIEDDIWEKIDRKDAKYWERLIVGMELLEEEVSQIIPIINKRNFSHIICDDCIIEKDVSPKALLTCFWNLFLKSNIFRYFIDLGIVDYLSGMDIKQIFSNLNK